MEQVMATMTPAQLLLVLCGILLALAGFINTVGSAAEKIAKVWRVAKAPNEAQDSRLDALEEWRKEMAAEDLPGRVKELEGWRVEAQGMLGNDKKQLEKLNDAMEASLQVQLALLDHALNGNNIKQMQDARDGLYTYLTHHNKRA